MNNMKKRGTCVYTTRRWRDSNGNTYHAVDAWTDIGGSRVFVCGATYGYGRAYEQTLLGMLAEIVGEPVNGRPLHVWAEDVGIEIVCLSVTDVTRKGSL